MSGVAPLGSAARAGENPWCMADDIDLRCDYATRQQCMATSSGLGASCQQNPRFVAEAQAHAAYGRSR
ncbi:DUF3551 domain-containing protein [Bradyrhizobium sp. U87765 SZCCT0131]|nr:DUF3551 domain-containing protein [Bradyrhizobium sp. U87765 SZCCT0131]MBR1264751.1 DUF3551 domain-containing protein [Bradyrhizobium sp. U87765 SZCCT0134]MBR1304343.1 DUF3551 domain-containing protein [Bradyrhizobium sp. U87765 SZCCT0110]MBR1322800.1 DUF3551 domain-containing protein [Bradyrhizobium sp. U87765 SZCCT0109]MBR1346272.1 DUF3551 domain-containing protein [Bradyrhizobium sp. U87765 SZCCT0048]